jgi:hypothetical protein
MECPKDGTELNEQWGRLPVLRLYGKTTKDKTKSGRYFECPKCHKQFMICLRFVEIEGAVSSFNSIQGCKSANKNLRVV